MGKDEEKVSAKIAELADRLIHLYANRDEHIGHAFAKDTAMQKNLKMILIMN